MSTGFEPVNLKHHMIWVMKSLQLQHTSTDATLQFAF